MIFKKMSEMKLGWFIGNFEPSILRTDKVEVAIKRYHEGQKEPFHFQKVATEITVLIEGKARMGSQFLEAGDIILLDAGEICDFEAITETVLVAVKLPSIPNDKFLA